MDNREWLLKRNCSFSPRQLATAYSVLCLMSLALSMPFALRGAWMVFGFALLETLALLLAFFCYARHAADREHIALVDGRLLIERVEGGPSLRMQFDPLWTRVGLPERSQDLIDVEARGVHVEIGRFVTAATRLRVAQELRQQLGRPPSLWHSAAS